MFSNKEEWEIVAEWLPNLICLFLLTATEGSSITLAHLTVAVVAANTY